MPTVLGRASPSVLLLAALALTQSGFWIYCRMVGTAPPAYIGLAAAAFWIGAGALLVARRPAAGSRAADGTDVWLALLTAAAGVLALTMAYRLRHLMALPVDLLSFAESPFLGDVLKLKLGLPLYAAPQDNSNFPYTPGAPILTYLIASATGLSDSIPGLRAVQFTYVILACVLATGVVDQLARLTLRADEYRHRALWLAFSFMLLFLVATDDRFNAYVQSLHNDGLSLLICLLAYWLMLKHALTRRPWLLVCMAVLPAAGFLVKQNQLMWAGVFGVYLAGIGGVPWKHIGAVVAGAVIAVGISIGVCYAVWGDNFLWWVFVAIGSKQISPLRTALHLFQAGAYASMGLLGGWVLALRSGMRPAIVLWLCWLLVFALEVYTTGVAWSLSHIGPGAVIATCWLLVSLMRLWPSRDESSVWLSRTREAAAAGIVLLLLGVLGFVREPRDPLPADMARYIADIEREFEGLPADKVLLDVGTWIYARHGVVMKDQSSPASIHHGPNQKTINHWALAGTIDRIERRTYDRILARELDTPRTSYDFLDRGSGIKRAIFANYHVVRRIRAVEGLDRWWPMHLVREILVLEPNRAP